MTIQQIKESFAAIYRKACIDGEVNGKDKKKLEQIKEETGKVQEGALTDGDTSLWEEMFNLAAEIDSLLGVDYADDGVCLV